ncbi:MAG: hypothetical protein ACFFFT_00315 [Candidatus Thorarchaeota archaeon]
MLSDTLYERLKELSKGIGIKEIPHIFSSLISEVGTYLHLTPLYNTITVTIGNKEQVPATEKVSILDYGVKRQIQKNTISIELDTSQTEFLPFLLLREVFYCFVPEDASTSVKICINQVVENTLEKVSSQKKWKERMRKALVDKNFRDKQYDQLDKFFKTEAVEPFEDVIQYFFKEVRENVSIRTNDDQNYPLYDILYEGYIKRTTDFYFDPDLVETIRILIYLFYKEKSYLLLSDYQALFKKYANRNEIHSKLSSRKFSDYLKMINKCTSLAPTYDINYFSLDTYIGSFIIKFNPLLDRTTVKRVLENWPFTATIKRIENGFGAQMYIGVRVPSPFLTDYVNYLTMLENQGYIKKRIYVMLDKYSNLNLNYFTDISFKQKIIDPHHTDYQNQLEIDTYINYGSATPYPLSMFDFHLIKRVRHLSVTGLTFDKRRETLNFLKEDIKNEKKKEQSLTKAFSKSIGEVINSAQRKTSFLAFLEKNKTHGFFYIHSELKQRVHYLELCEVILKSDPEIVNTHQFRAFLDSQSESRLIEEQILLHDTHLSSFLHKYFASKKAFRAKVEEIKAFYNIMNACYNLMIFDIAKVKEYILNPNTVKEFIFKREKRNKYKFKDLLEYKITNEKIDSAIEMMLHHSPPLLQPYLINTILTSTFATYHPEFILRYNDDVYKRVQKLKPYFPRIFITKRKDLITNKEIFYIEPYFIDIKEKRLFFSILYSYFKDSLDNFYRYFWKGTIRKEEYEALKDFYNFKDNQVEHNEDFFKQLRIYSQKMLETPLKWPQTPSDNADISELLWSGENTMDDLVATIKNRIVHQDIDFTPKDLEKLSKLWYNLESLLSDPTTFKEVKTSTYFKRYIQSIKFIPAFQKFGFSQYSLYFRPFSYCFEDYNIDFKVLFTNSFQRVKYPTSIEPDIPLYVEYIFPFRTPNKSYLNWLSKSKKNIAEYCLFTKKKVYDILHFNRNYSKEGWKFSHHDFKSYMEKVLFNPTYNPDLSKIRKFDVGEISESEYYGPESTEFDALTQLYSTHSLDVKSYLGTKNYTKINAFTLLLEKSLIFPYISLKNLDFQEKISIILPHLENNSNEKVIKIFTFFNRCRIYEIEGEFFFYGFEKEKTFENGLLLELWFPKCEIDEFLEIFELLFQFLEIKHHLILTDLVKGDILLQSVYGNLDFLEDYNPLVNLLWNTNDKRWMNHKLFTEKMEPIYLPLIP